MCFFSLTSFLYSCSSRYVGEFCEYLNPCHTVSGPRCQNGGSCTVSFKDGIPSLLCSCPIGFTASLCEIPVKNACDAVPCQNGGTCALQSLDKYTCTCSQGYTGELGDIFWFSNFLLDSVLFTNKLKRKHLFLYKNFKLLSNFSLSLSLSVSQANTAKSKTSAPPRHAATAESALHCRWANSSVAVRRASRARCAPTTSRSV